MANYRYGRLKEMDGFERRWLIRDGWLRKMVGFERDG
jgi:hypothetical protein